MVLVQLDIITVANNTCVVFTRLFKLSMTEICTHFFITFRVFNAHTGVVLSLLLSTSIKNSFLYNNEAAYNFSPNGFCFLFSMN